MLIIVLIFSPLLLPTVGSESYVTITTQATQVQTIMVGSSVITSLSEPQTIIDRSFKVNSTSGTNYGCETFILTFTGNRGQYVSGNFTSIIPLDFYIMPDSSYQNWLKTRGCASLPDSITSQRIVTSYNFNVALPDSGLWDIVLVNYSNNRDASGFMVAYLSSGSYTSTESLLSTITQTNPVQSTMAQNMPTAYSLYLIGGIIIAIIIAVALTAISVMKRKQNDKNGKKS